LNEFFKQQQQENNTEEASSSSSTATLGRPPVKRRRTEKEQEISTPSRQVTSEPTNASPPMEQEQKPLLLCPHLRNDVERSNFLKRLLLQPAKRRRILFLAMKKRFQLCERRFFHFENKFCIPKRI
jgi:hypothetical protein